MKRFFLFLLSLFFSFGSFSQQKQIDSLKIIVAKNGTDTTAAKAYGNIGRFFVLMNKFDSALVYTLKAKEVAEKINFKRILGGVYNNIGHILKNNNKYGDAIEYYKKALAIFTELNNKSGRAQSFEKMSAAYYAQNNYTKVLECSFAALKIRGEMGDTFEIAESYNNIGIMYYNQKEYIKAMDYFKRALKIREGYGDKIAMAQTYNNLGLIYMDMGNLDKAMEYQIHGKNLKEEFKDSASLALSYDNIAKIYMKKSQYDSSLRCFLHSLKISTRNGDRYSMAGTFGSISYLFIRMKKFKQAEPYLIKCLALAKEIDALDLSKDAYEDLSRVYENTGRYTEALHFYKKFIVLRDSLLNEENTKKSVRLEMNYEFEKKEAATKLEQEKKEAIATADSKKQKIIIWSVCGILLLVLVFAVFAYRSFLQKKKANQEITTQKHIIEEKQKEILDSIYYARRIQRSLLPSERLIGRLLSNKKTK